MAVDFNPQIQELGNRDWSGASRGTGPDRSFEALFGGLAQTADNLVTNRDQETQAQISQDAREMFESVNTEFGFDPPPAGMQGELDRIVALQNAMEQGKISTVNYYGRLATLSKQLRTKYPRYESIVDSTIQSVTGTRPANAYRDALISEMDALANSATADAKERRTWERQNEGIITAVFGEEYWADPASYDIRQVQSKVGAWKAETERADSVLKQLQVNAQAGQANTQAASRELDRQTSFMVQSALDRVANGRGFNQLVQDFVAGGGQDIDGLMTELAQLETTLQSELDTFANREFVQHGLLSREDANKAITAAMTTIANIREQVGLGNVEFATRMVTINNDIAERSLNDIYRQIPNARVGAGLSKMNPYAGATWLETTGTLDQITNVANELTGQALTVEENVIEKVLDAGDQRVSRKTIDQFFNVIRDPNAPTEDISALVEELFGPTVDFMSSDVVSAEDLQQIYTRFLDPSVTEAIVRNGTPEDLQKYSAWAIEKFRALPDVRSIAGNINQALGGYSPEDISVSYDAASNRISFRATSTTGEAQTGGAAAWNPGRALLPRNPLSPSGELLPAFIGQFNRALAVLDPIAEANGTNMEELVPDLLREMNRLEEGGRSDGFFKWMYDSISSAVVGEAAAATRPDGGVEIAGTETPDTDLDFITSRAEPSSSAYEAVDLDGSEFVEPRSNPNVDPQVLARFEGRRLPAAIRLNNMGAVSITGNIQNSWAARQPGFVGAVPRPAREGGHYAQYATPEHGVAAASRLLQSYGNRGINTPESITRRWAAEPGNYPNVLVRFLREAGFDVTRTSRLDLDNPEVRKAVLRAKSAHESGAGRPVYAEAVFERGVNM